MEWTWLALRGNGGGDFHTAHLKKFQDHLATWSTTRVLQPQDMGTICVNSNYHKASGRMLIGRGFRVKT